MATAATTTAETLIRELADRAALTDLVARHSLWIDEARYDETDALFTRDATVTSPRGEARGTEALVALARKGHDLYARTMHTKTNLIIDLNGDTATMRAHDVAIFALDNEKEAISAAIQQYTARRTNTGWRINTLTITPVALSAPLARSL
jgi:hypothetical protein